ncbi:50S ribosomal protein L23 [Mycoplasmopsis agassizii]|uniref:Large ribosomal subunit protein uL23 n=1 Tax=Mycoplasmopsis agassizii TaxID=33922 RepID=A0ABX4H675_9BACT|nr:50S ribosomal protein L23 [Mycoplasmopsis agassizii]PAF55405.1 50S ribosomal protein L23 [Mycoplasmopsis agassizii]SMC18290.1 LSU ribosomal protein L23P [Mycoplasmopsis agassizii]
MLVNEIIKAPILTEKSYSLMEQRVYTFKIDNRANKIEIAKAVEFIFNVEVEKVNLMKVARKPKKVGRFSGFTSSYKKAYVTLKEGHVINFFPEEAKDDKKAKKAKVVKEDVVDKDKADQAQAKAAAKLAAKTSKTATVKKPIKKAREGK